MAKILIVDDAEMNAELLAEMVGMLGFETEIAFNGKEAVDLVREKSYDIIFMDHLMPVMDGVAAMTVISSENLCPDTPVVMVTANDSAVDGRYYLNAGFSDYMHKPFSAEGIKTVLIKHGLLKEADNGEMWKDLSAKMKGINIERPREYCLSDPSFYLEILNKYMKSDTLQGIESRVESNDTEELVYSIRSAKDGARLIGADEMAELALFMERDLMEDNKKSFTEHLKGYRQLEKKLRKNISNTERLKHSYS